MRLTSRWLILFLLAFVSMFGDQPEAPVAAGATDVSIYVTAKGKTYHTHRDCIGLMRSKVVYSASEHAAQLQGLTLCGICAHRHHATVVDGKNSSWATAEVR